MEAMSAGGGTNIDGQLNIERSNKYDHMIKKVIIVNKCK